MENSTISHNEERFTVYSLRFAVCSLQLFPYLFVILHQALASVKRSVRLSSMVLIVIFYGISCLWSPKSWAQDPEFSQFYAAPSYLNPAMIGFSASPRFILNYRHQSPSFDQAYVTLAASYDQHFNRFNSSLGLSMVTDRQGGGLLNTYMINGLYAYQLSLTKELLLKAGVQVGYIQQAIDWSSLVLPDDIDPTSGVGIPSGTLSGSTRHTFDIGLGAVAYTKQFYLGAAVKHITEPSLPLLDGSVDDQNQLKLRLAIHVGQVFYFGQESVVSRKSRFYVSPNLVFINQGKLIQLNGGAYVGKGALFGGMFLRHTIQNADALIVMAGVKKGIFKLGYSYDVNLSPTIQGTNAHELSLQFDLGQTYRAKQKQRQLQDVQCPEIF